MGNCLINSLKEPVDNNKILPIGSMYAGTFTKGTEIKMTSETGTLPVLDLYDNNCEFIISLNSRGQTYTPDCDGYCVISNKYKMTTMVGLYTINWSISLEDLKYCTKLSRIVNQGNFGGDIENLQYLKNVIYLIFDDKIYGSLENLIRLWRKNGYITGDSDFSFQCKSGSKITCGNEIVQGSFRLTFDENKALLIQITKEKAYIQGYTEEEKQALILENPSIVLVDMNF